MPAPTYALTTIDGSPIAVGQVNANPRALPQIQPSSHAAPIPIPNLTAGTLSHTIRTTYATRFIILNTSRVFFGNAAANYSGLIPNGTVDAEIDMVVLVAKVISIILTADHPITIKTNSSTVPQETIALPAIRPLLWNNVDSPYPFPYAGNISKFYVTNLSGADAVVKFAHLLDLRA